MKIRKDLHNVFINPGLTFDSGQAFRWRPLNEIRTEWIGIVSGTLLKISRDSATLIGTNQKKVDLDRLIEGYFTIEDDVPAILSSLPQDEVISSALSQYEGLRLLTQDPWECLISFVCSINCNIPSIKLKIENLSRRFGQRIETGTVEDAFSFPEPETLAKAEKGDLLKCKVGFRWRYIRHIAKKVVKGDLDLEKLRKLSYSEAQNQLISEFTNNTLGVGPKVADCTLLYSLRKTEAFPIDVWILRCMNQYYRELIGLGNFNTLTSKKYNMISESMRRRFGRYAGYAQLYLYAKTRSDSLIQDR